MKLFVGNLSYQFDDARLRNHFEQYGTVIEAQVLVDRETGQSRGTGRVVFESEEAATKAISDMHDKELDGRPIEVHVCEQN